MMLSQAIDSHIRHQQSAGLRFKGNAQVLKAFLRMIGDIPLERITTENVHAFLDASHARATSWRKKYGIIKRFSEHWNWRDEMPFLIMPDMRRPERQTFVPYIYTRAQVRSLLSATKSSQKRAICKANAATFRMFVLMLYGTGAKYSEIMRLKREDIALKRSCLIIRGTAFKEGRSIPIGADLKRELQTYLRSSNPRADRDCPIFLDKTGHTLGETNLSHCFQRVRRILGIKREGDATYAPRLHDLRFTFAVHRITSWIRSGADLNRLIPALSAYMGNISLESANEYLSLTPERFRKELKRLSPRHGRKRWRNDPELMRFLSSL